jgi:chemotaxis protein methyltransferase CheR
MSAGTTPAPPVIETALHLVRQRTGLVFGPGRRSAFEAGLARAMQRAHPATPDVYLVRLQTEPALLDDLVAEITVGETYFFREPEQFAVLGRDILPALLARTPRDGPLRIWSAGCATGEEPYTVAILLRQQGWGGAAHIVATDLSRRALAAARRGLYGRWSLRGVPEHVVRTYFTPVGGRFELAPAVRGDVEFRYLNLAEDAYPSLATGIWGMDLILCRNVLIYFDRDTIARVARRLLDSLSDDGWLLLGASDPPLADLAPCDVVVTTAGLAYRRPARPARPACPGGPAHAPAAATCSDAPASEQSPALPSPLPTPTPIPPPPPPPQPLRPLPVPEPAESVADRGLAAVARAYAERDYPRAAELARRAVQHDGGDPAVWVLLVRALANRGDLRAAGHACAAALDRHRTCAELAYLHAVLLAEAGRHADAAGAARRALYLDRTLAVAHLALGAALARLGDARGARRALRNAERLLAELPPGAVVPASDGEPAARLAEIARAQLGLLQGAAA